jgi:hypothetical protein
MRILGFFLDRFQPMKLVMDGIGIHLAFRGKSAHAECISEAT